MPNDYISQYPPSVYHTYGESLRYHAEAFIWQVRAGFTIISEIFQSLVSLGVRFGIACVPAAAVIGISEIYPKCAGGFKGILHPIKKIPKAGEIIPIIALIPVLTFYPVIPKAPIGRACNTTVHALRR
jgi:hypothetical protein